VNRIFGNKRFIPTIYTILTKTKYLSIGKHGHNLSLKGNDTIKDCDNYKHLWMKIGYICDNMQF
jgi:hypothetical protein